MKEIPLTKGKVALVDDEDYDRVNTRNWYASFEDLYYAVSSNGSRKPKTRMHRFIMNVEDKSLVVDHINGDTLDNQKNNLRICKVEENVRNSRKRAGLTSKYKGVSWAKSVNKWYAYIMFNKKSYNLGYYSTEEEAALVYNKKAIEFFGQYAKINNVKEE